MTQPHFSPVRIPEGAAATPSRSAPSTRPPTHSNSPSPARPVPTAAAPSRNNNTTGTPSAGPPRGSVVRGTTTSAAGGNGGDAPIAGRAISPAAAGDGSGGAAAAAAMLPHPLVMQATVLRNPDWHAQALVPELVEPGDILFDVLRAPQVGYPPVPGRPPSSHAAADGGGGLRRALPSPAPLFGTQAALTLPATIGAYVTQESFKALLCFFNAATYPLAALRFSVEITVPARVRGGDGGGGGAQALPEQFSVYRRDLATLGPKANYTFPVDVPLHAAGTHTLSVRVHYVDAALVERKLSWASSFPVEQAVTEAAQRSLRCVPLPPGHHRHGAEGRESSAEAATDAARDLYALYFEHRHGRPAAPPRPPLTILDATRDVRLPRCFYVLSVGLRNTCSVPLTLSRVELLLPDGGPVALLPQPAEATPAASGRRVLRLLQPGEQQQHTFAIVIDPAALGPSPSPLLMGGFGCVEWEWHRANGDGGKERSSPLRLARPPAAPPVDVAVLHVRSKDDAGGAAAGTGGPLLQAGQPVEVVLWLLHNPPHSGRSPPPLEVALKVRPERLAPYFLYSGPALQPLGPLVAGVPTTLTVTLLPWQSGALPLLRAALQIVDARAPDTVLWPAEATTQQQQQQRWGDDGADAAVAPALGTLLPSSTAAAAGGAVVTGRATGAAVEGGSGTAPAVAAVALTVEEAEGPAVLCEVLVR